MRGSAHGGSHASSPPNLLPLACHFPGGCDSSCLGAIRQWIESVFWTCKGQLTLERHGGRTHTGLAARVALRLLALAAALWHNQLIDQPGRHLAPYTH